MTLRTIVRAAVVPTVFAALPLIAYAVVVRHLADAGASGVVLGAISGDTTAALAETAIALLLRVYTVVVLPAVVVLWIARVAARRVARGR